MYLLGGEIRRAKIDSESLRSREIKRCVFQLTAIYRFDMEDFLFVGM